MKVVDIADEIFRELSEPSTLSIPAIAYWVRSNVGELNNYLNTLNCKKHIIIGMMLNKEHEKYISYFKDNISSITTIDIPNQPNAISGKQLKEKFKNIPNVKFQKSIEQAIQSIKMTDGDLLLITGSLYLCAEVLNLN